jgi:hypothetical protein
VRKIVVSAFLCGVALVLSAFPQSGKDLIDDAVATRDVLTFGMGYNQPRFSP